MPESRMTEEIVDSGIRRNDDAESIGQRIVSLPFCPNLTEKQQNRVIETMKKVFNKE